MRRVARNGWARGSTLLVMGSAVREAQACAVCFGDPDSAMAQGVVWGVLVLVGIVGFVLAGVAGTALFWLHRSRRLGSETWTE